ncbi:conidiation-specific protein (con-13) protein [Apiospora hydei]|uniref:Conidiation-specific protein (Con-13) protein n=1 Tax=Apiospora hydei TaxID=1337664 RepID=A0ABR1XBI9_9PEZI
MKTNPNEQAAPTMKVARSNPGRQVPSKINSTPVHAAAGSCRPVGLTHGDRLGPSYDGKEVPFSVPILGKVPVGMRQHVAHIILAPESHSKQKLGIAAETKGTTTSFLSAMSLGIAVHEFSHILDAVVVSQRLRNRSLSRSLGWKWFYDSDTKVPTDYAVTSLVENFADAGRWAMSNMAPERVHHQNQTLFCDNNSGDGRLLFRNGTTPAN